jgi:O-antigen ligase
MKMTKEHFSGLIVLVCIGLFFGFTLSPALMSIGIIGLACIGIYSFKQTRLSNFERFISIGMLIFYLLMLLSYFYSSNKEEAQRKLILKLPILLFPLLLISLKQTEIKHRIWIILGLSFAVYLPGVVSVYNYWSNKTLFDQLILESKPLPIEFGYGIYHIQYSILLSVSIILNAFALLNQTLIDSKSSQRKLLLFLTLINTIILHILSARTGLLAFYVGAFTLLVAQFRHLSFKVKTTTLLLLIILPVLMYFASDSFSNRMINSVEDFKVAWQGKDANDYSFAMRVQAWKNASQLIKAHPFTGVGIGDADQALFEQFKTSNPSILPHNRKNPHLQLLETAVQSGLISSLIFLILCIAMAIQKNNMALRAISLMLFVASCFESLLERQSSVIGFAFILAFALSIVSKSLEVQEPASKPISS